QTGDAAGALDFADDLLVLNKGAQAVKDVVVATLNARRAGTASTLSKGEVAGSNKKPWKQKGTGRARAGLRQSPVWRGGGVAFGPKPRDFSVKVNRKVAQLAFRHALSGKIAAGELCVIEAFDIEGAKTRHLAALLKRMGLTGRTLLVPAQEDAALRRAARNLQQVGVVTADKLDVYSLLAHRAVVVTRAGFETLASRMRRKPEVAA
ncbi:MAG: 50S ribosomal protein L4, partial [Kiritimatiellae bacterium]|nr:50S ribosomal protein L4 [Kiritimatiellia bacterium]